MRDIFKTNKYIIPFILGLLFIYSIKFVNRIFLPRVEHREGIHLFDPILQILPASNLSVPIFILLYSSLVLGVISIWKSPHRIMVAVFSFAIMYLIRLICIICVPLEAPDNLIPLYDPVVSALLFHDGFLTKDLFFSGHLASIFLFFIFSKEKHWKYFFLCATSIMATMILIQHIHYTIDILGAIVFSILSVNLSRKLVYFLLYYTQAIRISLKAGYIYTQFRNGDQS
ncbi:MAG: hypothetical protein IPH96_07555 [Saprospiraceae bacterium]|nr:hypothetical protein [Saprospiraceae bacterium]